MADLPKHSRQTTNSPMSNGSPTVDDRLALGRRILDLADNLAHWSESTEGLTCTFFSDAHRAVARQLRDWFAAAGLVSEIDPIGNVVGRMPGARPGARTVILGSHYDTVRNAGKYDGRLGILCALVVLESLRGARLPFAVELIGFSEEEGVRFATPYLGSRAVVGGLDAAMMNVRDRSGHRLGDVIAEAGRDPTQLPSVARRPEDIMAYLEVHIEQGPVLLNDNVPVGIVTAIAGGVRYALAIEGEAGHAGTVPMDARRDALLAAAEIALFVERRARPEPGLLGTVGRFEVPEGAINVIPRRCELSLDVRAQDDDVLAHALADILAESEAIAGRRGVRLSTRELLRKKAVPCAPHLQRLFAASIEKANIPVKRLASGAGHDAATFDGFTDIGMLFVRCGNGGISHSPLETITAEDAGIAAQILRDTLMRMASWVEPRISS
jgi:beta-ureidopropionase / N-carbamoyl-L-amino-acid hydrolase